MSLTAEQFGALTPGQRIIVQWENGPVKAIVICWDWERKFIKACSTLIPQVDCYGPDGVVSIGWPEDHEREAEIVLISREVTAECHAQLSKEGEREAAIRELIETVDVPAECMCRQCIATRAAIAKVESLL